MSTNVTAIEQVTQKSSTELISKAVGNCVNRVHTYKAEQAYEQNYYSNFDAYFNSATQRVEDNVIVQGQRQPLFIFRKCMAEMGFPLE
jgi:hypothetical protein